MSTVERMIRNGYYVSVTPDSVYEQEIQMLIKQYPIERLMVETDGPWPFSGPFENDMTHPRYDAPIHCNDCIIKKMESRDVYEQVYDNTKRLYLI